MKTINSKLLLATSIALASLSAHAHDPKEHMAGGEAAHCEAMQGMDHTKMDMKDPVVQAMMQKCMQQMHSNDGTKPNAPIPKPAAPVESETHADHH